MRNGGLVLEHWDVIIKLIMVHVSQQGLIEDVGGDPVINNNCPSHALML